MNISEYINKLLPSFSRDQLIEEAEYLGLILSETTLPVLERASETFGKREFVSATCQNIEERFDKNSNNKNRENFLTKMYLDLKACSDNIPLIRKLIEDYYANDVVREALTLLKVNLLQWVEVAVFAAGFSVRLVNMAMTVEVNKLNNIEELTDITQSEVDYFESNLSHFISVLNIIAKPKATTQDLFSKIPDVAANNKTIAAQGQYSESVDPMKFGLIPVKLNPVFHVRMALAKYQAARHRENIELAATLQLRIAQLDQELQGRKNPNIERQIDYNRKRLEEIRREIRKVEEENGSGS